MSVTTATNAYERKRKECTKLKSDLSKTYAKLSDAKKKEARARTSLQRASSQSSLRSKANALDAASANVVKLQKAISDLEAKVAKKEREVADAEKKLTKERNNQHEKELREADKALRSTQRANARNASAIADHTEAIADIDERLTTLESLPEKITVLMMACGPTDQKPLRLGVEAREIRESLERSRHRDSIELEDRWAVRTTDLFQALNDTEPTIVHFSGHGMQDGCFIFEDEFGNSKPIEPAILARALATVNDSVRLLIFNACFSEAQASEVVSSIQAAIGMTRSISDKAAIVFASQIYSSIGFGISLEKAFRQACAQLLLECPGEEDIPKLILADGEDAALISYADCYE